jgi:DNA-binding NtrC family response regulator
MQPSILIVDDEAAFAKTLAERLSLRNFQANVALNGKDALDLIGKINIDVVILDLAMPGIDGIETLKEIKRMKPFTEVIMLTGHATVETAFEGLKVGAMDYLIKPCEVDELSELIHMAFKRKSMHEKEKPT